MTTMTSEEKQQFLADLHVGVIGINEHDRGPLTVPIWYSYVPGGDVQVITGSSSRKGKLLQLGSRVSLAAQAESLPYKYVSIEGEVTAIEPADMASLTAMAIRYLGESQGKAYADNSGVQGQITVSITPKRWLAVDYGKME
ncbi:MAG: pyridoxamine 5'-phosphate oxidase family protein [Pseudomonadales bacterium]|jgi:nitroimidazol reductase NimA-like FMN-containing flavoprotein (pyridoxamine 5'-phosphate oxidase superfamily)|nr:pyridoxamine 5'-phosphate oxidase family protein [Pseudomonadales bacterium]